jgi:hypothetical protein
MKVTLHTIHKMHLPAALVVLLLRLLLFSLLLLILDFSVDVHGFRCPTTARRDRMRDQTKLRRIE